MRGAKISLLVFRLADWRGAKQIRPKLRAAQTQTESRGKAAAAEDQDDKMNRAAAGGGQIKRSEILRSGSGTKYRTIIGRGTLAPICYIIQSTTVLSEETHELTSLSTSRVHAT